MHHEFFVSRIVHLVLLKPKLYDAISLHPCTKMNTVAPGVQEFVMRYIRVWARIGPLLLLLYSVQGCGLPSPVTTPPAGDLIRLRNEQVGYASGSTEATKALEVLEMRDWGYAYVDRHCVDFFAAIQRGRSQGELASNTLAAAAASTAAILALAEATTKATGVTAAALGFAGVTLTEFRRTALLTDYPEETQELVRQALTSYRDAARAPTTFGEAASQVAGYAQICTLAGIRSLVRDSLMSAKTKAFDGNNMTAITRESTTTLVPIIRIAW